MPKYSNDLLAIPKCMAIEVSPIVVSPDSGSKSILRVRLDHDKTTKEGLFDRSKPGKDRTIELFIVDAIHNFFWSCYVFPASV